MCSHYFKFKLLRHNFVKHCFGYFYYINKMHYLNFIKILQTKTNKKNFFLNIQCGIKVFFFNIFYRNLLIII